MSPGDFDDKLPRCPGCCPCGHPGGAAPGGTTRGESWQWPVESGCSARP